MAPILQRLSGPTTIFRQRRSTVGRTRKLSARLLYRFALRAYLVFGLVPTARSDLAPVIREIVVVYEENELIKFPESIAKGEVARDKRGRVARKKGLTYSILSEVSLSKIPAGSVSSELYPKSLVCFWKYVTGVDQNATCGEYMAEDERALVSKVGLRYEV